MIRNEAVQIVQNRLGQRSGLEGPIAAELQLKQLELEHSPILPWFLVKEKSDLVTVAAQRTLAVPTDFLREHADSNSLGSLWLTTKDGNEVQLRKGYYDVLRGDSWLDDNGQPSDYALVGGSFYFFPCPDDAYPLRLFYYAKDDLLTDQDDTNKWLENAPDLLIAAAGVAIAKFLRDQAAIQLYMQDLAEARQRLITENIARAEASGLYSLGG